MNRSFGGRSRVYQRTAPRGPKQAGVRPPTATIPGTWTFIGEGAGGSPPVGPEAWPFVGFFNWAPMTRRVSGGAIYGGYYACSGLHFARWNVALDTWTGLTAHVPFTTSDAILGINGGELIMVALYAGGSPSFTYPYNIGTDTWGAARTPHPESGIYAPAMCQSDDGFIYVISGQGGANQDSGGDNLNSYRYEMATDTWTTLATLDVGFWSAGCDVGTDGKVYVIGGERDSLYPASYAGVVRVYDPGSNTWDTSRSDPPLPAGAAANGALDFPVVAQLPDGKLLYGGGQPYNGGPPPFDSGEFWVYDPATDTFTPTAASDSADPALLDLGNIVVATDGNSVYAAGSSWDVFGRYDYGG